MKSAAQFLCNWARHAVIYWAVIYKGDRHDQICRGGDKCFTRRFGFLWCKTLLGIAEIQLFGGAHHPLSGDALQDGICRRVGYQLII